MSEASTPLYGPALRMKTGELTGLRDLAHDVAQRVLPRLIVPPRADRDEELQRELMAHESVPAIAAVVSRYWRNRPVLIDATYLIDDFGADTTDVWLPKMIEMALAASVQTVPLVPLRDLQDFVPALRAAVGLADRLKLAVRIPSGDMVGLSWRDKLLRGLNDIGVEASDCGVIADFCDAEFSQPELVSGVIQGALETLQEVGLWQYVIFQGTNFPEKNPADHSCREFVARNEWKAWRRAIKFEPSTADHMLFGDYAADSSKMAFGGSGGRAIRHYRYTTPDDWMIERGANEGSDAQIMRDICSKIVASDHFAGRTFSAADDFIYLTAKGLAGPGNSTSWRAINTNHHITRVVTDVGAVRAIRFADRVVEELPEQQQLFKINS